MYQYIVKEVVDVIDGDTIDVIIDLGFSILFTTRIRLAGIDSPESRTSNKEEKALGLITKSYLKKTLKESKSIIIKTEKANSSEKYGRFLGWIYINDETRSLNEKMVEQGYAWNYLGETKTKDLNELKIKQSRKS